MPATINYRHNKSIKNIKAKLVKMTQLQNISVLEISKKMEEESSSLKVVYKQQPKPNIDNWAEVAAAYKISPSKVYDQPPVCIHFVNKNDELCKFATLGNFSAVIGKAKSRKTFLLYLILAAALKTDTSKDMVRTILPKDKSKIIHIDTEQAEFDVSQEAKSILSMTASNSSENIDFYSFRALTPADRLFLIEQLIYTTKDLGILVIDGIRDLITDINSPEEATMISCKLLKWTQERHIHIIVVIHQNKGDGNARGHVGTELINKAE